MIKKTFDIFGNNDELSLKLADEVREKMGAAGYDELKAKGTPDYLFCIGGDGALLRLLRAYQFPDSVIIGINTGHLGFFQEVTTDGIDDFIQKLNDGNYHIQEYIGLKVDIYSDKEPESYLAINEVVIRGEGERLMHLEITIGENNITRYSGDGILICTPAGSTAYNYALGGVIIDPEVDALQITPMAPVNNSAYRSFTSGIMVPTHTSIEIKPVENEEKNVIVIEDGRIVASGKNVSNIAVKVGKRKAKIFRFSDYDFWAKVKSKILES